MPNSRSKQLVAGLAALHTLDAASLICIPGEYVTKAGDVVGDIVEMGAFPRDCIVVDFVADTGALGAGATLDAGLLSGEYADPVLGRTMTTDFVAAAAAATEGVIRRNRVVYGLASSSTDRSWGVRFQGANPTVGRTIRGYLICAPKLPGVA